MTTKGEENGGLGRSTGQVRAPRANQNVVVGGATYCRTCHETGHLVPTHPGVKGSAYCEYHYKEARSSAKRKWRENNKARRAAEERAAQSPGSVYVGADRHVVLGPDGAEQLRGDLLQWRETLEEVVETLRFAEDGNGANAMVQRAADDLAALSADVEAWAGAVSPEDPS